MVECSLKTGLDLPDCIELATSIMLIHLQIEELAKVKTGNVPVQNQIFKLKKEIRKMIADKKITNK